jgi:hypothetical protein
MTKTEELHIECPPATAVDLMADVQNITRWNDSVSRAEMTTDAPIGQGSQFITVNRRQQLDSTITTFDRPERLASSVTSKLMDMTGTFTFTETDAGTTLVMVFDPSPKGVMSVLFPLLSPLMRRDLLKQHAKFKKPCEIQAQSKDA